MQLESNHEVQVTVQLLFQTYRKIMHANFSRRSLAKALGLGCALQHDGLVVVHTANVGVEH